MAVLSQTCGWKWRMVQLHMHIFPSIYPSSNLLYGNLWAKGSTFLNGPWWIFPSVNLLSWTYVHSLLPLCNMWCDGKKTSFLLLLDSFLASFHPLPQFVLCKELCPVAIPLPPNVAHELEDSYPVLSGHPIPSWGKAAWLLILDKKPSWGNVVLLPEWAWLHVLQVWEFGATALLYGHQEWVKAQFNTFHSEVLRKWNQQRHILERMEFWLQNKSAS